MGESISFPPHFFSNAFSGCSPDVKRQNGQSNRIHCRLKIHTNKRHTLVAAHNTVVTAPVVVFLPRSTSGVVFHYQFLKPLQNLAFVGILTPLLCAFNGLSCGKIHPTHARFNLVDVLTALAFAVKGLPDNLTFVKFTEFSRIAAGEIEKPVFAFVFRTIATAANPFDRAAVFRQIIFAKEQHGAIGFFKISGGFVKLEYLHLTLY